MGTAYIRWKVIRGDGPYAYLVRSVREGKRVRQVFVEYIGKWGDPATNARLVALGRWYDALGAPKGQREGEGPVSLSVPPTARNVRRWVDMVESQPETQEIYKKIAQSEPTFRKYKREDGTYEPERAALHERIARSLLNPAPKVPEGERPVAVFLLGQPGSGKSTVLNRFILSTYKAPFTVVNADEAQAQLPGYEGWKAPLYHEEGADIAEGLVTRLAIEGRHNVVFDWTGANRDKVAKAIDGIGEVGYDVHLYYVDVPVHVSVWRAYARFQRTGRWVPLRFITERIGKKPLDSYQALKARPYIRRWEAWSNDVPEGTEPVRLEAGVREVPPPPGKEKA